MIELAIAGGMGGLLKSLLEGNGRIALPGLEVVKDMTGKDVHYVHLGFVANVLLGIGIAYFTTTDLVGAFTAGMASAFLAEKASEVVLK